ncbi:MAG: RIP metalloprotease RseP [Coraliomargaritaceae bacterium]
MVLFNNVWHIALAFFALGFCIFIHELGHFIAAKKRGLIADRFSIGFGPRIFGWKWKGTDFRLSLLPLGGYVSLPQLAEMGRLEGGEGQSPRKLPPISYTDKMIVAVMGAVFNILLALLISMVLWAVGREEVKTTVVGNIATQIVNSEGQRVPGPGYAAGVAAGDEIIRVDGRSVNSWWKFQSALVTGVGRAEDGRPMVELSVLRDGQELDFAVYPELVSSRKVRFLGLSPETDEFSGPIILRLIEGMPAEAAGLQPMDRILKLDDDAVVSGSVLSSYLADNANREINITVERRGKELVIPVRPKMTTNEDGTTSPKFGFYYDFQYKTEVVHDNPIEQLYSFADTMQRTLYALLHKKSDVRLNSMSGPVGIVHGLTLMSQKSWIDLLWFTALINVNLAIFNLLPFPVLDGGHMLFATISKCIGRPLPIRLMETLQIAFVVLLLGMMLYVTRFDIESVGRDTGLIKDKAPVEQAP